VCADEEEDENTPENNETSDAAFNTNSMLSPKRRMTLNFCNLEKRFNEGCDNEGNCGA